MAESTDYGHSAGTRPTRLPQIGGVLSIAGTFIGTGIFVLGCFGFSAAFSLWPLPLILGSIGLVLSLAGWCCKQVGVEDPHVVAALLTSVAVIVGALLEMMIARGIPIFASSGGM